MILDLLGLVHHATIDKRAYKEVKIIGNSCAQYMFWKTYSVVQIISNKQSASVILHLIGLEHHCTTDRKTISAVAMLLVTHAIDFGLASCDDIVMALALNH